MVLLSLVSFASLTAAVTISHRGFTLSSHEPRPLEKRREAVENVITLPLRRSSSMAPSQKYLRILNINGTDTSTRVNRSAPVKAGPYAASYLVKLTFGNQTFDVVVDTGSADTWVVQDRFRCADPDTIELIDLEACGFGPGYHPTDTLKQILDQSFNVIYADGEMIAGYMATENIGLANITVPNQQIGIVTLAAYWGDDVASGLLGLAYPNITQAFPGNDPFSVETGFGDNIVYNTLFTNMYEKLGVAPVFSLAIDRNDDSDGVLALGGVPDDVPYEGDFVSTPIKMLRGTYQTTSGSTTSDPLFAFYAIDVYGIYTPNSSTLARRHQRTNHLERSSWSKIDSKPGILHRLFPRQEDPTDADELPPPTAGDRGPDEPPPSQRSLTMIVDSGTTILYIPDNIADAINMAFDPPAICDVYGNCFVSCYATAPNVSIRINDTDFNINPRDMILDNVIATDDEDADALSWGKVCSSGVSPAGDDGLFVLGDVFLKNVLAVFDVGAAEMRFAARENY